MHPESDIEISVVVHIADRHAAVAEVTRLLGGPLPASVAKPHGDPTHVGIDKRRTVIANGHDVAVTIGIEVGKANDRSTTVPFR
jgi:hypothetical protein